jgi:hypothetical protein
MLTNTMKSSAIRVLATLALAAVPGFASPIFVNNFSFEDGPFTSPLTCGTGCTRWTSTPVATGWTGAGASGTIQPGTSNGFFTSLITADGPTSAQVVNGTMSQLVSGVTVLAGTVYTLQVDIGYRADTAHPNFVGSADLLITDIGGVTQTAMATGLTPTKGTFDTWTATYVGTAADVGGSITIQLNASGDQGNFDNVRLYQGAVPEPASFLLIGSALLGLSALKRRRSNA